MPNKKVLLVDDVHLILELEKAFLKGLPVDIVVAHNGAEALDLAKKEHPDLIYLDFNMPVMDGPTCCKALKADPVTKGIPVIMVTTAGREEDELVCRASGCDDYITKPINNKIFLEKGRNLIADFERRRRRYNYSADVQFLENGEPRHGLIADISKGGLFMAIPHDAMPDNPVDLAFSLPHEGRDVLVAARGQIAWENRSHSLVKPAYPAGVGVEFTDIDPAIVIMIEKLLNETHSK